MSRSGSGNAVGLHDPMMEEYQERKKKWYLDVKNTPCARSALVHGILGGVAVGLLYFARSSLPSRNRGDNISPQLQDKNLEHLDVIRRSCDFAIGGFVVTSLTSWEICRFGRAYQRADVKRTVQVLNSVSEQMADRNGSLPAMSTDRNPASESGTRPL